MEKRETGVGAYYFCDIAMSYSSRLAREANNHFGITGYGASNAFWHGGRVTARYKGV